jgi:uncharacterized protein
MHDQRWPWYLAGTIIGLVVPALLLIGGKQFGVSANLRHFCALAGARPTLFRYDWKSEGAWNLVFAAGLVAGGFASWLLSDPGLTGISLSAETARDLQRIGLTDVSGIVPKELVSWSALVTAPGFLAMVGGGFLVGFGARWAGGCTSGHAITGLSTGQAPSLAAVLGFFAGGLLITHVVLPWIL